MAYDYTTPTNNQVTVTVLATYAGQDYSAEASISLDSPPAVVTLNKLESYYVLDTADSINIGYTIENYAGSDDVNAPLSDTFRFEILRDGVSVATNLTPESGDNDGTYTLYIDNFTADSANSTSYRQVYTVTMQAKNGADSTWSYDSFMLYVYDEDALKIMVGEDQMNGELSMSNVDYIASLDQTELLALNRDIYLQDVISVNYGTYAWGEIADQMKWVSADSTIASVNYQEGTLYENIEDYTYVSYRPTTDFILSGLSDGSTNITVTHSLTGMAETLNVKVDTLTDQLYLFQCYPQATTTLTFDIYTDASKTTTKEVSITSDATGAAAYYWEYGIASDVYCKSTVDGDLYLGTFYLSQLATGEGDITQLERYPSNNLQMRQAAYAYLYVKNPDGTPYVGDVTLRSGVYVEDEYEKNALFGYNNNNVTQAGDVDHTVTLGNDGMLEVVMDQTQWGLIDNDNITAGTDIQYVFQIEPTVETYYPLFVTLDSTINVSSYANKGEAVVNFRTAANTEGTPFIAAQTSEYTDYATPADLIDNTGSIGPNTNYPEVELVTTVMWWGESSTFGAENTYAVYFTLPDGRTIAETTAKAGRDYPFATYPMTEYSITLNESSLAGLIETEGGSSSFVLQYCQNDTLVKSETMAYPLVNMIGVEDVQTADSLSDILANLGKASETEGSNDMSTSDVFANFAFSSFISEDYTSSDDSMFSIQVAPTSDPTQFLGLISVSLGNMEGGVSMNHVDNTASDGYLSYLPSIKNVYSMIQGTYLEASGDTLIAGIFEDKTSHNSYDYTLSGYAESLIYYDFDTNSWNIQILSGGFEAGGGISHNYNLTTWVGPVPITSTITVGGSAVVSLDTMTVTYTNGVDDDLYLGTDFLTQLKVSLYVKAFAGIGFDYSVVALKLGIYGQIGVDFTNAWLNRPYMEDGYVNVADDAAGITSTVGDDLLYGNRVDLDGQVGIEFYVKFLFLSYNYVLFSYNFLDYTWTHQDWTTIEESWAANQAMLQSTIDSLLTSGAASVYTVAGQDYVALNAVPTMESRDYLDDGDRNWGTPLISTFALDTTSALANLETNTYPYANPMVSDDGQIVAYLTDQESTDTEDTRAAFATMSSGSYVKGGVISDGGYGDSSVDLAGTEDFAVSAWVRQTQSVEKDAGAILTTADQMVMMNSTEIFASLYNGSTWTTTQVTDNSGADLTPVVATNGNKAIVAWRSVASSATADDSDGESYEALLNFDEQDTILYKLYDGTSWGNTQTLYNGTNGNVKAIVASMLDDGTAAVAYTLDIDSSDNTITDREISYAVIDTNGDVTRNVRATNDDVLDENPQITAVTFPNEESQHFVLGWYTEDTSGESDIRLLEFNGEGYTSQLMPDSLNYAASAADVTVTSSFRFVSNAESITDLSIIWVERAQSSDSEDDLAVEKDVLKGIKFYVNETNNAITFTGAIDVAEMDDSTLIDHFDAYVSDASTNEIKAVILGTTYGEGGTETTAVTTVDNDGNETVVYISVPSQTSAMYTATENYQNSISVTAVIPDYDAIYLGSGTQVYFTVQNNGIHAVEAIEIQVGDDTTKYTGLNLLPGGTIQLSADYVVSTDRVVDPEYTVSATFDTDSGATGTAETQVLEGWTLVNLDEATGTVLMDLPDLSIANTSIVAEGDGKRTIQVKLNNHAAASVTNANSGNPDRWVELSFWADSTYTTPLLNPDDSEAISTIVINNEADLAMIDKGGYSTQVTFDVAKYLGDGEEILTSGINVYIKAEVIRDIEGTELSSPERTTSDNYNFVTCENLQTRIGEDVQITSDFAVADDDTTVTVNLLNTRLSTTESGNITVTLLDADGTVLDWQQSYSSDNEMVKLTGEGSCTRTFTFTGITGATQALVTYNEMVTLDSDSSLGNLSALSIGTNIVFDDNNTATITTEDLTATTITATPNSTSATGVTVTVGDGTENVNGKSITLSPGQDTTVKIVVTAQDDTTTTTYTLTINNLSSGIEIPNITDVTAVYHQDADAIIETSVTTGNPSATFSYQWYAFDESGTPTTTSDTGWAKIEGATADTYSVDTTMEAGTYYYYCAVTSTNSTETASYDKDSNIVAVEIGQSSTELTGNVTASETNPTYGDTITITVTPTATGEAPVDEVTDIQAIGWSMITPSMTTTATTQNQLELYGDDGALIDTIEDIKTGETYTFTIDTANKDLKIGENTLTVKYVGYESMDDAEGNVKVTLSEKALTATLDESQSKIYDATVDFSDLTVTLGNIEPEDADEGVVTATVNGTVTSADVSDAYTLTVTDTTITAQPDGNYYILNVDAVTTNTIAIAITPRDITAIWRETNVVYDGTGTQEPVITFIDSNTLKDWTSTVETEGDYEVTIADNVATVTTGDNFTLLSTTVSHSFVVQKAPVTFTLNQDDGIVTAVDYYDAPFTAFTVDYGEEGSAIPEAAGTYEVTVTLEDGDHYRLNGSTLSTGVIGTYAVAVTTYTATFGDTVITSPSGGTVIVPNSPGEESGMAFVGWSYNSTTYKPSESYTQAGRNVTFTPVYQEGSDIGGMVTQSGGILENAVVTLMSGSNQIDQTITDTSGAYSFDNVLSGTYNIVVNYKGIIKTAIVSVLDEDTILANIEMPTVMTNSVVEVAPGTPAILVGGLDKIFQNDPNREVYTAADADVVKAGGSVEFKMTVERDADTITSDERDAIESAAKNIGMYLDISLTKTATPLDSTGIVADIATTPELLTIVIPLPGELQNMGSYTVYRMHDDGQETALHTITTQENEYGEHLEVNDDKTELTLYVKNFSTYAIGYTVASSGSTSLTYFDITITSEGNGRTSPSGDIKIARGNSRTIEFTPNSGYEILDVLVDGESVGVVDSYTFGSVYESHTLHVIFSEDERTEMETVEEASFFNDVDVDNWFYDAVVWAVENGVTSGKSETSFAPYDINTRAEAVTFLWRSAGSPSVENTENPFTDVAEGTYYYEAVLWAVSEGITAGTSSTTFSPNQTCARSQIVTFLWRMMDEPMAESDPPFTDVPDGKYYYNAVLWAVSEGITSGTTAITFSPDKNCTRAEIVTFLYRTLAE